MNCFLKRLYIEMHGFIREESPYCPWKCWRRKGTKNSNPNDMVLEFILYSLSWEEIIKRYGKSRESV